MIFFNKEYNFINVLILVLDMSSRCRTVGDGVCC
jgi:hypothetical protein